MKYHLSLKADAPIEKIFNQESGKQDRSLVNFEKNKITITAKDAVALKASANNIIKALVIYEKTEKLVKNE